MVPAQRKCRRRTFVKYDGGTRLLSVCPPTR